MMQQELEEILAQAVLTMNCLTDLSLMLELAEELLPDRTTEEWVRQVRWLIHNCKACLDCEIDVNRVPLMDALQSVEQGLGSNRGDRHLAHRATRINMEINNE